MSTTTPTSPPKIYTHPSPRETLLPHLLPLLPYTLPLVRRIQFHFQSPYAQVLSTIAPGTPPPAESGIPQADHPNGNPTTPTHPFLITYLDRSRAPETECWLFSIELPSEYSLPSPTSPPSPSNPSCPSPSHSIALSQLLALLAHMKTLPLPPGFPASHPRNLVLVGSIHLRVLELLKGEKVREGEGRKVLSGGVEDWRGGAKVGHSTRIPDGGGKGGEDGVVEGQVDGEGSGGDRVVEGEGNKEREGEGEKEGEGDKEGEGKVDGEGGVNGGGDGMIEAVEANPAKALIHGSTDPKGENARGHVRGHTVPTKKFLFSPELRTNPAFANGEKELPEGLEWDIVREAEYALVRSRTAIPRQDRTMRLLGSVGVRRRAGASGAVGGNGESWNKQGEKEEGEGDGDAETEKEGDTQRGELIAWAFLGPDGSLTTLHVEPEFRGKGIAKMLTRRLFRLLAPAPAPAPGAEDTTGREHGGEGEGGGERLNKLRERAARWASGASVANPGETHPAGITTLATAPKTTPSPSSIPTSATQTSGITPNPPTLPPSPLPGSGGIPPSGFLDIRPGEEWAHSDVYIDNLESAGVARSLGGAEGWWVFWAWLDSGV